MAAFYGSVKGNRGEATRLGSKGSGVTTIAASWAGSIETRVFDMEGESHFVVEQRPWQGSGVSEVLASGKVGEPHGDDVYVLRARVDALEVELHSMRVTLKLAAQWLGKAHAEGVHHHTVMPNHLDYTISMVEAAIKGASE